MSYAIVDAATMAPAAGPHPAASPHDKGVGQALGVRTFGIYQIDLPAGGGTVGHDHRADGAEDVYAIVAGTGWVVVDGQDVPVRPGQYIAVTPGSARHVHAGDSGLSFIAVCACPAVAQASVMPPEGQEQDDR